MRNDFGRSKTDHHLLWTLDERHLEERAALLFDEPVVEELHEERSGTDAEAEDVQHDLAERRALQIVRVLVGEHGATGVQVDRMPFGQAGRVGEPIHKVDQIDAGEHLRVQPIVEIEDRLLQRFIGDRSVLDLLLTQVAGQQLLSQIRQHRKEQQTGQNLLACQRDAVLVDPTQPIEELAERTVVDLQVRVFDHQIEQKVQLVELVEQRLRYGRDLFDQDLEDCEKVSLLVWTLEDAQLKLISKVDFDLIATDH